MISDTVENNGHTLLIVKTQFDIRHGISIRIFSSLLQMRLSGLGPREAFMNSVLDIHCCDPVYCLN